MRSDKLAIAKQVLQPTSSEKQPLGCVCESESHSEVKGNLSLLSTHLGQSLASPSQPWRWPSPRGLHLGQVQSLPSCLHTNYGLFSHALSLSPFSVPLCPAVIHCVPHRQEHSMRLGAEVFLVSKWTLNRSVGLADGLIKIILSFLERVCLLSLCFDYVSVALWGLSKRLRNLTMG